MNKNIFFIFIILLFISVPVQSKRLYTWGIAKGISINAENKCITSYESLEYCYKNNGVFSVYKDGLHQGNISFGLFGVVNDNPYKRLMNDYSWTYDITENTKDSIIVQGYNNYETFQWRIELKVEKYAPLKIKHTVKNNLGYDLTNSQLFYLIDVNQETNPYIYYEKQDGTIYQYNYSTDKEYTQADTNFAQFYNRVSLGQFRFLFDDLIDNNFFITRTFFGNLSHLDTKLPDTNGFVTGFSKGNKTISSGTTIISDPTISTKGDNYDGWITYKNGIYYTAGSNVILTGAYYTAGNYDWYRAIIQFDITDIGKVKDANFVLNLFSTSPTYTDSNTCVFDLNSITDIGSSIDSSDWSSTVFELSKNNWFNQSVTAGSQLDTNVENAWNNNKSNNRDYLAFRIGIDNEPIYDQNICYVTFCDTGDSGNCLNKDPYIDYIPLLDVNVLKPNINQYFGYGNTIDGNYAIDFNILSSDNNYVYADIYYSTIAVGFTNLIVNDLNLFLAGTSPTADVNCASNDFSNYVQCFYDFNFLSIISDGNYFIDVNIHTINPEDGNATDSSDISFYIDSTASSTSWDGNHNTWQNNDANIHLTCTDGSGSGCNTTKYRLDTNAESGIAYGNWVTYDANILISTDGNRAIDFNSTDLVGNIGDTNTFYVLVDKSVPTIIAYTPSNAATTSDPTPSFTATVSDPYSGVAKCYYKVFKNDAVAGTGSVTPSNNICSYSLSSSLGLAQDQNALVQWTANDNVDHNSTDQNTGLYTFKGASGGIIGGGGGGGVSEEMEITVVYTDILTEQTINMAIIVGRCKKLVVEMQNSGEGRISGVTYLLENLQDLNITLTKIEDAVVGETDITLKEATNTQIEQRGIKVFTFNICADINMLSELSSKRIQGRLILQPRGGENQIINLTVLVVRESWLGIAADFLIANWLPIVAIAVAMILIGVGLGVVPK